jgi:hypothetical protein
MKNRVDIEKEVGGWLNGKVDERKNCLIVFDRVLGPISSTTDFLP